MTFNADVLKEKFSNIVDMKKLKAFSTSNAGLVSIAVILFVVLISLHFMRKHSEEKNANANFSAWSTSVSSSSSSSKSPTYSFAQAPDVKGLKKSPKNGNVFVTPDNQSLQTQMTALKQEVSLLEKQVNQLTLSSISYASSSRKPYQLLGVRFDENSKQWVADIKSEDTLYSLKAGETFEGWHVLSVDHEGARIE